MKTLHSKLLSCLFIFCVAIFSMAQKPDKKQAKDAVIQHAIDSQSYIFHAQQALPMVGGTRQLTSEYDLRVTPDSIISYLPYFGRAYYVPYNQTDGGGINVNTNKFNYIKAPHKKGGWDISIKPTERMDVQDLTLFISPDGYATLKVTSINRQPISFFGYVSKK